jgi:hypothetical protein
MTPANTTGWGFHLQGSQANRDKDSMGAELSVILDCPVHYPAFDKGLYECECGIVFPQHAVKYAWQSKDWSAITELHSSGYKPKQ